MNIDKSAFVIHRGPVSFEQVMPLFIAAFGTLAAENLKRIWDWKYYKPPFQFADGPRMFTIVHTSVIIGYQGAISCRIKIGALTYPLIWAVDFAVHPNHQRMGHGIDLLRKFIADQPDTVQMGTPIPGAYKLGKKLGSRDITDLISFKRVPDPLFFFRNYNPLIRLGTACICAVANVLSDLIASVFPIKGLSVVKIDLCGPEFDRFWESVKDGYEAIVVRDSAFLNWRFLQHHDKRYTVYAAQRDGQIAGYVVTRFEKKDTSRSGYIVDILTKKNDAAAFDFLLRFATNKLEMQKAAGITCTVTPFQKKQQRSLFVNGFVLKKRMLPVVYAADGLGSDFLPKVRDWYLTLADSDFEMA